MREQRRVETFTFKFPSKPEKFEVKYFRVVQRELDTRGIQLNLIFIADNRVRMRVPSLGFHKKSSRCFAKEKKS